MTFIDLEKTLIGYIDRSDGTFSRINMLRKGYATKYMYDGVIAEEKQILLHCK